MRIETVVYKSDYTGKLRFALRVDDKYPVHLDFDTHGELKGALSALDWINEGKPTGYEDQEG